MTFTVTYRGKDGALRDERMEAVNRAECVAECRRRGIAPVGIKEGRSGKSTASPMGRSRVGAVGDSKRTTARWAVAAVVAVIAIAGGVWWWIGHKGEPKTTGVQQQGAKPKAEKPAKQPKASRGGARPSVQQSTTNAPTESTPQQPIVPVPEKIISCTTNASGYVVERVVGPDGRTVRRVKEPPSIWETPTDGLINMVLSTRAGQELAPLPPMSNDMDAEFMKSLEKPIKILPGDDERTVAMKKAVEATREEIRGRMEKGEHFADILNTHRELFNDNCNVRASAMRELQRLVDEGDEEQARKYAEATNEILERMGITPLHVPSPGTGRDSRRQKK